MTVLVFPSSLEASAAYATQMRQHQLTVIGASSVNQDPYIDQYDTWVQIPYIHEEHFIPVLKETLARHNISAIFTPHAPSYLYLEQIRNELQDIKLLGQAPYVAQMDRVNHIYQKAAMSSDNETSFIAGLLNQADQLYGECSHQKILAMAQTFQDCPQGDIVEIGTFFGKSALMLNRLAVYHKIGPLLAIDPWSYQDSVQHNSSKLIQDLSNQWDWNAVFRGFLMQAQGCHAGQFNYLRMTSTQAWQIYQSTRAVTSSEFGMVEYTGRIAVLHIDGNHDIEAVMQDLNSWSQKLALGAWIIFDDYQWSQGDGPQIIADRLLIEQSEKIDRHFTAGGALFVKIKEKIHAMD